MSDVLTPSWEKGHKSLSVKVKPLLGLAQATVLQGGCTHPGGGDLHTAVSEGQAVRVAGEALLLTVIGAGGWSEGIARVDIVGVDRLPPGSVSAKKEGMSTAAQHHLLLIHIFRIRWLSFYTNYKCKQFKKSKKGWHLLPASHPQWDRVSPRHLPGLSSVLK